VLHSLQQDYCCICLAAEYLLSRLLHYLLKTTEVSPHINCYNVLSFFFLNIPTQVLILYYIQQHTDRHLHTYRQARVCMCLCVWTARSTPTPRRGCGGFLTRSSNAHHENHQALPTVQDENQRGKTRKKVVTELRCAT